MRLSSWQMCDSLQASRSVFSYVIWSVWTLSNLCFSLNPSEQRLYNVIHPQNKQKKQTLGGTRGNSCFLQPLWFLLWLAATTADLLDLYEPKMDSLGQEIHCPKKRTSIKKQLSWKLPSLAEWNRTVLHITSPSLKMFSMFTICDTTHLADVRRATAGWMCAKLFPKHEMTPRWKGTTWHIQKPQHGIRSWSVAGHCVSFLGYLCLDVCRFVTQIYRQPAWLGSKAGRPLCCMLCFQDVFHPGHCAVECNSFLLKALFCESRVFTCWGVHVCLKGAVCLFMHNVGP